MLQPGSSAEPPFGRGILLSRQAGNRAVVYSVPTANAIYRDVLTSVFNNTYMLPFTLVAHGALQDAFFFVKEDAWRAQEDKTQLKRFGSQFNTTFHEKEGEAGSGKVQYKINEHSNLLLLFTVLPQQTSTEYYWLSL